MRVQFTDTISIDDGSGLRFNKDGFLVASPRVARTGIQEYKGAEIGQTGKDAARIYKVYRPESSVFDEKAMKSLAHRPITLGHKADVNAKNWKQHAVGISGDQVIRDGDHVRVPMMVMDGDAIQRVKDGYRDLSVGYGADIDFTPGKTPGGEDYDAFQSSIEANHIAIVAQARGGPKLRLGDSNEKETEMVDKTRKFVIDGYDVELEDGIGQAIERSFKSLTTENATLKDNIQTLTGKLAETKQLADGREGQILALNKQLADAALKPEALDKLVSARLEVVGKCRSVLGDSVDVAGKSDMDLKRLVVSKSLGDDVAKSLNDVAVDGAFIAVTKDIRLGDAAKEIDRPTQAQAFNDALGGRTQQNLALADKAWEDRGKFLADAWKNPNNYANEIAKN